ncbi:unnamed protein product [Angiostrongylus costaricensis]|uniref:Synembryn-B n=1 Tax=Angiostrongylus costaricensis TaxID=334426 RepID=A0A0R3PMJ3_ANGCS|nr:unnamed protein product [Angiostrongylus costaricensis]
MKFRITTRTQNCSAHISVPLLNFALLVKRLVDIVLPPMVAADVTRRPEEGDSLRNKIIRVMMSPTFSKDLASEFMFVLCKKSVNRLIKYTGLGHSAGLLANSGLLSQINLPKSASDSEDSETEDYKAVEDRINPVTGYLRPESSGVSPFEGMSEEQKEYEAMKLVDAMSKLMDTGMLLDCE